MFGTCWCFDMAAWTSAWTDRSHKYVGDDGEGVCGLVLRVRPSDNSDLCRRRSRYSEQASVVALEGNQVCADIKTNDITAAILVWLAKCCRGSHWFRIQAERVVIQVCLEWIKINVKKSSGHGHGFEITCITASSPSGLVSEARNFTPPSTASLRCTDCQAKLFLFEPFR
jgi:hypothetical protein